jgi:hypothetical protein
MGLRGGPEELHWDGSDVLPKINVPTLIISGNEDVTTLPSASDRMEQDIRSSTRVSIARAAHLGPVEQYEQYAAAIAQFTGVAYGGTGMPVATAARRAEGLATYAVDKSSRSSLVGQAQ